MAIVTYLSLARWAVHTDVINMRMLSISGRAKVRHSNPTLARGFSSMSDTCSASNANCLALLAA